MNKSFQVIPKVLPKTQFNCQSDIDIVNEICEIRNVDHFLLGNGGNQRDGTTLSIDFKNAFRTMNLRWLNSVMRKLDIPDESIEWFYRINISIY